MTRFACTLLLPPLAACTAPVAENAEPAVPSLGSGCDAASVQDLIGQEATADLGAEIQQRTGAQSFRWLQPGQIVTMEFREDRVNVHLDAQNRVRSINCG